MVAPHDMLTAIGLMSGTSRDGIDAALIRADGQRRVGVLSGFSLAYAPDFRTRLGAAVVRARMAKETGAVTDLDALESDLTDLHAAAVFMLLQTSGLTSADIDVIGFHGHTLLHRPEAGMTWQIGDGAFLARRTGLRVVHDFRQADMAAGGEGAPLLPVYHRARITAAGMAAPVAILNLGGVANVTWVDPARPDTDDSLLAFDCGPGNAPIDDWVARHTGETCDRDGALAASGRVGRTALAALMAHPYFHRRPPKSLDRDDIDLTPVADLSPADGAATLTAFAAEAAVAAAAHFPAPAGAWYVTGGGRHNPTLMTALAARLDVPVAPVEDLGWNRDMLEAEGFAYMAVRSLHGLPISFPATTGARAPTRGGILSLPDETTAEM